MAKVKIFKKCSMVTATKKHVKKINKAMSFKADKPVLVKAFDKRVHHAVKVFSFGSFFDKLSFKLF